MTETTHHIAEADRVRANTWPGVNERLDKQARLRILDYDSRLPAAVGDRIRELDREWDFDRVLETEASSMGLTGLVLALAVNRRFLAIPGFVAAMVLLHGIQGWYPLLPIFRRLGIRTRDEIDRERYALKAIRGDFDSLAPLGAESTERADKAWSAVCA